MNLPRNLTRIIVKYLDDPLKKIRQEYNERLLLGNEIADADSEFFNSVFNSYYPLNKKIQHFLYKLFCRRKHPDLVCKNEVVYLAFLKRFRTETENVFTSRRESFELFLGGEDSEYIKNSIEERISTW